MFKHFRLFLKICVQFQAFKNLYSPKKQKYMVIWKFLKKKSFGFRKKLFGSNTDTKIGPWFRFSILKPGFGRTLVCSAVICFFPTGILEEFFFLSALQIYPLPKVNSFTVLQFPFLSKIQNLITQKVRRKSYYTIVQNFWTLVKCTSK